MARKDVDISIVTIKDARQADNIAGVLGLA